MNAWLPQASSLHLMTMKGILPRFNECFAPSLLLPIRVPDVDEGTCCDGSSSHLKLNAAVFVGRDCPID